MIPDMDSPEHFTESRLTFSRVMEDIRVPFMDVISFIESYMFASLGPHDVMMADASEGTRKNRELRIEIAIIVNGVFVVQQ